MRAPALYIVRPNLQEMVLVYKNRYFDPGPTITMAQAEEVVDNLADFDHLNTCGPGPQARSRK